MMQLWSCLYINLVVVYYCLLIINPGFLLVMAQCPPVNGPTCTCESTSYEPVSITCSSSSLQAVLQAIAAASDTKIDSLAIVDTPIPQLPALAFQGFRISKLVLRRTKTADISPQAFDGPLLDSLNELTLEDCGLTQIPTGGPTKLKNLKKLMLRTNQISMLPPRAMNEYASQALLEKLDFYGNQIAGIGTVSLEGLTALKEISFEKNLFTSIPTQGLNKVQATLEDLNLGLNAIPDVQVGALTFPKLKTLSLEFNQIPSITPEAFNGVPNMQYLYVGGNKFTRFDPDMFRYLPKLLTLGIGDTAIDRIPANAFQYTPVLRRLEMSGAAVANIDEGAFQRISGSIQFIIMNNNQLMRVPRNYFQGLSKLQSLDLKKNVLNFVENGAWADLPALRHLDISSNRLETLEPDTFRNTFLPSPDARVLYLCDNPWRCDGSLEWLRRWLRQERDILIDQGGTCIGLCANWPGLNIKLRDPDPAQNIEPLPVVVPSRVSPLWIILAVILSILLASILMLAIVRGAIARRRRRDKEREEEERILRSSQVGSSPNITGAGGSVIGSAYPASAVDLDLPPATSMDMEQSRHYWY